MKKLLLYVVLLMTVGCAMLGCTGQGYFYDGDYVYWVDYNNKFAVLKDVKNIEQAEGLELPLTANGYPVRGIGGSIQFQSHTIKSDSIKYIHIPYTVYWADTYAFFQEV